MIEMHNSSLVNVRSFSSSLHFVPFISWWPLSLIGDHEKCINGKRKALGNTDNI